MSKRKTQVEPPRKTMRLATPPFAHPLMSLAHLTDSEKTLPVTLTSAPLSYRLFNFVSGLFEVRLCDIGYSYGQVSFGEIITSSILRTVHGLVFIIDKKLHAPDLNFRILCLCENTYLFVGKDVKDVTFSEEKDGCLPFKAIGPPTVKEAGKFTFETKVCDGVTIYQNLRRA